LDPDTYLSQFIALFNHIEVYPPDLGATIALVLSVLLLGCSGFVSASEIAFFSLSPTDVGKIEENRHAADGKILELKKDSERLLATILISNNFVNVAIIMLLVRSRKLATKVVHKEKRAISVDELEQALELTDKKYIAEEQNMLEGIIRFGGEMAKEIMTPRMDIVDLDMKTPYPEVLQCIVESNYSRIPVYADSRDNIKGVLYIKDLLPHLNKPANFRWQSLIRPPYFVPETKMIDDLLGDFQKNKVHIAIVVDEFGGTSGIVTMEDIIEEIVGEINDEYDEDERQYVRLNANTYVFEAKVLLTDFFRIMKLDDDFFEEVEGEADTLAGLLLEIKGEFPERHEVIKYKNYCFEVLEMDDRRILKIKVTVESPETSDEV